MQTRLPTSIIYSTRQASVMNLPNVHENRFSAEGSELLHVVDLARHDSIAESVPDVDYSLYMALNLTHIGPSPRQ